MRCSTPGEAPAFQGDWLLVQSALHNILDNAIKYSSGQTQVALSLTKQDGFADIVISDSGPGFQDGDTEALLKRYARGQNAEGVVGSGLGLTIVDEVMRAHGGSITLTNNTGGGACVTLSFPLD